MKRIIILLAIPLLFAGCREIYDPYDQRLYYKAKGVGYVYYKDTNEPAPNALISIWSDFMGTVHEMEEEFYTDSSGYFCLKFLKRTNRENVISYSIQITKDGEKYRPINISKKVTPELLQKAKGDIQIDTLWLELNPYWQNK